MSDDKKPYEVGYKKPPPEHQFKKGEPSRNPRGRRKGVQNFATLIREGLQQPVVVLEKGVKKKMTAQKVIVQQVIAKAMKADLKAGEQIFKFNPRVRGEDLVEQAEETFENWLESLTNEELQDFIQDLKTQSQANEERNRKAKKEAAKKR
jgi:hypothetical protein